MTPSSLDEINDAVERARHHRLCPYRVWAIARSCNGGETILPELIPPVDCTVLSHDDGNEKHDHCTFDFCECSRIDYTFVKQRHECLRKNCANFQSFSPEILKNAAEAGHVTAWKLNGESTVNHPEPFMAISHVWADGTGTGTSARPEGQVNKCLYDFFCQIAEKFKCTGIWWDTICIPREKEAKMKAINNMHSTYANARVTLVHDCYLREWEWSDANSACFAIVMSPWFTRGWTALELAQSRKVKVMFKSKDRGYVIKDLDHILEDAGSKLPATQAIRNLRKSSITVVHDLLSVLGPRVTSKPKDMAIIAALLAGMYVPGSLSQQEIYQRLLRKFKRVAQSQLFHSSAPMSGSFSWCPTNLFDMPVAPPPRESLDIYKNGSVEGWWKVFEVPQYDLKAYSWSTTHPLMKAKIEARLSEKGAEHLLLVELQAKEMDRALLVKPVRKEKESSTRLHCQLVGPIYFRHPKKMGNDIKIKVIIGDMEGSKGIGSHAWEYAKGVHEAKEKSERRPISTANLVRGKGDPAKYEVDLFRNEQTENPSILSSKESQELLSTMLLLAAEKGDSMVAELLLRHKAKPGAKDSEGRTALLLAAMNGHKKMVELLLQHGAKPDAKDSEGRTALLLAAMSGDEKMVELLLPEANPNIQDDYSWTALHYAARRGYAGVITELLKRADPNIQDNLGQLPLHLVAERFDWPKLSDWDVIRELWRKMQRVGQLKKRTDGQTVLHCAAWGGYGAVTAMIEAMKSDWGHGPLKELDIIMYATDNDGKTALDVAAENGDERSVDFLLSVLANWTETHIKNAEDLAASNEHTKAQILLRGRKRIEEDRRLKRSTV